jgi:hypothetical protein
MRSGLPNSIRWSLLGSSEQLDLRSISNASHELGPVMPVSEPSSKTTDSVQPSLSVRFSVLYDIFISIVTFL